LDPHPTPASHNGNIKVIVDVAIRPTFAIAAAVLGNRKGDMIAAQA
jgi:hypothetical protein